MFSPFLFRIVGKENDRSFFFFLNGLNVNTFCLLQLHSLRRKMNKFCFSESFYFLFLLLKAGNWSLYSLASNMGCRTFFFCFTKLFFFYHAFKKRVKEFLWYFFHLLFNILLWKSSNIQKNWKNYIDETWSHSYPYLNP